MTSFSSAARAPFDRLTNARAALAYLVLVIASLGVGAAAAGGDGLLARGSILLLALVFLGLALNVHPESLFVGWLFAAPFLQTPLEEGVGKLLNQAVYLVPPLLLIGVALTRRSRVRLAPLDALPALFLFYVFVSALLISSEPSSIGGLARPVYVTAGLGIVAYYFLVLGPISRDIGARVAGALIWSGLVISAMVLVEGFTGWNLWNDRSLQADEIVRAVATLANPAVLGTFLGFGFILALAILLWKGPAHLLWPSRALLVIAIPALFFTYTRGPILAIAVVGVTMVFVANRARWPSLIVLILVAGSLYGMWDRISATTIYENRLSVSDTAETRLLIQEWSFRLIEQEPVVGTGFGSFDRVKNETEFASFRNIPEIYGRANTSHNSFLTILVELGFLGLVLLLLPWAVLGWRAVKMALARPDLRWILGGVVAILVIYVISASTFDARFFSLVPALPWIAVGIGRRIMADAEAA